MGTRRTVLAVVAAAVLWLFTAATASEAIASPEGIVLTVVDADGRTVRTFTIGELEALGTSRTTTATPWIAEKVTFEGPLLSAVLEAAGLRHAEEIRVTALNDYYADYETEEFRKWPVVLATRMDGAPIPVRKYGPLFVMYPFDDEPTLRSDIYYSRSVWQVKSIHVRR